MKDNTLSDTNRCVKGQRFDIDAIKNQADRELSSVKDGIDRYNIQHQRQVSDGQVGDRKQAKKASQKYEDAMVQVITDHMNTQRAQKRRRSQIYRLLGNAMPEVLARLTLSSILSEVAKEVPDDAEQVDQNKSQTEETAFNLKQNAMAHIIAQRISNERHLTTIFKENSKYFEHLMDFKDVQGERKSQDDLETILKNITDIPAMKSDWTTEEKSTVGHTLLDWAIEAGFVTEGNAVTDVRVSTHKTGAKKGQKKVSIKTPLTITLSDEAQGDLDTLLAEASLMRPALRPMVCKPLDWSTATNGGYLTHRVPIVKRWISDDHKAAVMNCNTMQPVYQAVNAAQSTPWMINEQMLEVVQWCLDEEVSIKGLVGDRDKSTEASRKKAREKLKLIKENIFGSDMEKLTDIIAATRKATLKHTTTTALRITTKKALHIADDLVGKVFYFPQNMDYRGRLYPMPGTFHPQSTKPIKSMMQFAEAKKPLTEEDTGHGKSNVFWLKVHVATCAGDKALDGAGSEVATDKVSMEDRADWTDENRELITSFVYNWKSNSPLWSQYDDPFGFLAAAFELVAFWDGEEVFSRVSINFDGSCSGAQHVACLFKDEKGGKAVNLVPTLKDKNRPISLDNLAEIQIRQEVISPF